MLSNSCHAGMILVTLTYIQLLMLITFSLDDDVRRSIETSAHVNLDTDFEIELQKFTTVTITFKFQERTPGRRRLSYEFLFNIATHHQIQSETPPQDLKTIIMYSRYIKYTNVLINYERTMEPPYEHH